MRLNKHLTYKIVAALTTGLQDQFDKELSCLRVLLTRIVVEYIPPDVMKTFKAYPDLFNTNTWVSFNNKGCYFGYKQDSWLQTTEPLPFSGDIKLTVAQVKMVKSYVKKLDALNTELSEARGTLHAALRYKTLATAIALYPEIAELEIPVVKTVESKKGVVDTKETHILIKNLLKKKQ